MSCIGHAFAEPAADLHQQRIADRVPERVVDFLEMVEIEAQHRELVAALDQPQGLFELLAEQRPVRQVGQRVMARHVRNLFLGLLPFGDVFEGRDPAAALHRLIDDADRAPVLNERPGRGVAGVRLRDQARHQFLGIAVPVTGRFQVVENVDQQAALERHAGPLHHLGVALVEQHDAALRIEHAQSLRHVFERRIEDNLLSMQFALGAAIDHRNHQRHARE